MARYASVAEAARAQTGRLRLIATVENPGVIRKILARLGLTRSAESPGPAPPQPVAVASARATAGSPAPPSG